MNVRERLLTYLTRNMLNKYVCDYLFFAIK